MMKKIIYSFALMMLAVMPASAQEDSIYAKTVSMEAVSASGAASSSVPKTAATEPSLFDEHNHFDIQYVSRNVKGEYATLSARVYIPEPWDEIDSRIIINHVVLNCHPTVTSNFEAPTGAGAIDKEIQRMCGVKDINIYTSGCYMVVCPDYCGYGVSSYQQHPYLIHDITAANCIDAVRAAVKAASEKKILGKWDLDIVGYSQGGATALACTKYIHESKNCSDLRSRLRQTVCGDGPYSTLATVKQYLEWGVPAEHGGPDRDLEYPCVLPLIIEAAKQAYSDGCMKTVETKDYFTEAFLNTGIMDLLKTKVTNTDDLNNEIRKKMPRQRPVDLFSKNIINPNGTLNTTTNEYKCLIRALEKADLTTGWTPQKPLTFYHLPNDGVVPYANFEAAKKGFGLDNSNIRYIEAKDAHDGGAFFWLATKTQCLENPNFELTNHADGGTLFYIDYMFGTVLRKD